MVSANPLHGANLNSLRSGAQKLAFSVVGSVKQFSDFSDSCTFMHDGTKEMSIKMSLSVSLALVLIPGVIKSSFLLEKMTLLVTETCLKCQHIKKLDFAELLSIVQ